MPDGETSYSSSGGARLTSRQEEEVMSKIDSILVFANRRDRDAQSVAFVSALARQHRARVTLVDVLVETSWMERFVREAESTHVLAERAKRDRLEAMAAAVRAGGVDAEPLLLFGDKEWLPLVREVQERGHDLLVKHATGERGRMPLFGSTAQHLFRKCPCPVYALRDVAEGTARRVVVAIDMGDGGSRRQVAARALLDFAGSFVQPGAEVHVVHAWDVFGESFLARDMTPEDFVAAIDDMARAARRRMDDLLVTFEGRHTFAGVHAEKGDPAIVIPALTRGLDAELLILGSTARGGLQGILIGNTAESILNRVTCSVAVVKAPGFVSPVTPADGPA
jgi:universal stress protein E